MKLEYRPQFHPQFLHSKLLTCSFTIVIGNLYGFVCNICSNNKFISLKTVVVGVLPPIVPEYRDDGKIVFCGIDEEDEAKGQTDE